MTAANINNKTTGISPYEINIQEQIIEAFRVFDENESGQTEIKNVGIIARALGRVPRKAEIKQFIKQVEDPDAKGFVRLEVLLPALKEILLKDKWRPAPKEQLLQAFEFFDFKHTGRLSPTYMRRLLTEHGDKLNEAEVESFLSTVVNPFRDKIEYGKICEKLVVPEIVDIIHNKQKILSDVKHDI
ncbi:Dynein regulatory complex protein 8 [Araneus ventricosus]|uniref:Dynein regulatory complex protein 8 n=1 Tax=Araneus ventricosus TaxID=182803 RepID=A0A4Y2N626_ARAVE|nr:Dynein regulatory complex protein 8 [Araneus ventricosus]